jgi:hypothetical protein
MVRDGQVLDVIGANQSHVAEKDKRSVTQTCTALIALTFTASIADQHEAVPTETITKAQMKCDILRLVTNPMLPPMASTPASKLAGEIEELPHNPLDFIVLALAGVLEDNPAALVHNVLRRPILVSIGVPRGVLIVLRDRIADTMALEGGLKIAQRFLEWKLRCMDADDYKALVPVRVVEPSDMR